MDLFKGLYGYECVMMILGIILFLVLVFVFVFLVIKNRDFKLTLAFFIIPIIMIGYPSIQKIKYDNGAVEIDQAANSMNDTSKFSVANKPISRQDSVALTEQIKNIEGRASADPKVLVNIGKIQLKLGHINKATEATEKAIKIEPRNPEAIKLQKQIKLKGENIRFKEVEKPAKK
jgi:tetratricopeptide (TPR) repeat protein